MRRTLIPFTLLASIFFAACSDAREMNTAAVDAPADRPSPEEWSAQQASASQSSEDVAAAAAAAGRAMGEVCGFSPSEMSKLRATEQQSGDAYEAKVAQHLEYARAQLKAQVSSQGAAFKDNCEFTRLMLQNQN